jgi:hypothetical protein
MPTPPGSVVRSPGRPGKCAELIGGGHWADHDDNRVSRDRKILNHVRPPRALGLNVTIEEPA